MIFFLSAAGAEPIVPIQVREAEEGGGRLHRFWGRGHRLEGEGGNVFLVVSLLTENSLLCLDRNESRVSQYWVWSIDLLQLGSLLSYFSGHICL